MRKRAAVIPKEQGGDNVVLQSRPRHPREIESDLIFALSRNYTSGIDQSTLEAPIEGASLFTQCGNNIPRALKVLDQIEGLNPELREAMRLYIEDQE